MSNTWATWDGGTTSGGTGNTFGIYPRTIHTLCQIIWEEDAPDVTPAQTVTLAAPAVRRSRHRAWLIEEAQAYAARQAEATEAARLATAAKQTAQQRAEALLLSHLTAEQAGTFRDNKWFVVEGGKSKRKYRVRTNGELVANIDVMDGDRVAHRLCGHINHTAGVPTNDHFLAQKVMLELAEDEFLRLANRH